MTKTWTVLMAVLWPTRTTLNEVASFWRYWWNFAIVIGIQFAFTLLGFAASSHSTSLFGIWGWRLMSLAFTVLVLACARVTYRSYQRVSKAIRMLDGLPASDREAVLTSPNEEHLARRIEMNAARERGERGPYN